MYQFGKFRFDPTNHLLLSEENPVSLTPKAFDVLLVLVQNANRLATKEELMHKVWPDSFVEEANLTVNISALRRLLGKTEDGGQFIETVPKKGYRFLAPVLETPDQPPTAGARKGRSGRILLSWLRVMSKVQPPLCQGLRQCPRLQ